MTRCANSEALIGPRKPRSAADLLELAGLVERGDVKPPMGEMFPLEQAREAQDTSQQGKILLKIG
ncbi:MAG TPA: zinc-binding dehydrogenase [Candidatus Aquilonibacter sp.]|nr:zinc-binding dehydrogenase [Candidatus Aquilonibacter sp.]